MGTEADEKLDMDQIVVRLLAEKEEIESGSFKEGFGFGMDWAMSASYSQLLRVADRFDPHTCDFEIDEVRNDSMLFPYFFKHINSTHKNTPEGDCYIPVDVEQWIEGWLFGVIEFWREVSYKMQLLKKEDK